MCANSQSVIHCVVKLELQFRFLCSFLVIKELEMMNIHFTGVNTLNVILTGLCLSLLSGLGQTGNYQTFITVYVLY